MSVSACVNLPGYGYNGRVSQPCPTGSYSAGDNYGVCISCPRGFTTAGIGAGVTEADCGVAAGWGNVNGTILPCPIGAWWLPWRQQQLCASSTTSITCCVVLSARIHGSKPTHVYTHRLLIAEAADRFLLLLIECPKPLCFVFCILQAPSTLSDGHRT